ncbi:MAG: right-handed parallel beta-helix repeat-containing protein [Prevotella sp.]|nr:right-handed parallel beta-helix repeat-containing protein [Bacteroidaceae bacterium]MBR1505661.1 right-handed parallel beta-helix repeat-containing protein [Prevotella sp.]
MYRWFQDTLRPPYKGGVGWVFFLLLVCVCACDDYDTWTTSPAARLEMSRDTVAFDTLITDLSSTTQTLIVSNTGDKGVRIRRVELALGDESPFRVNVDGQYLYGGVGEDFEVRRKDSIYVRIEVKLPAQDSDSIHEWQDELLFTLESGTMQKVTLTASGMDVIILRGETVADDRTLSAQRPYLIYDSLVVAPGATLTLPEGCTLMFHDQTSLLVHGTLLAQGTVAKPVVFRGDRTDRMFPYLPYDNTPNRWGGIHFFADSHDNRLTQCDIHSGDYGIQCDSTVLDESALSSSPLLVLEDCVVHNIGGPGLQFTHCHTEVTGTQISNTLGHCVELRGGAHTFVHCTVAQFYPLSANRGDALSLGDSEGDVFRPLYRAHFLNCVITGYADDVIMGHFAETTLPEVDFLFLNSLLRTPATTDVERFRSVRYDLPDSLDVSGKDHFRLFDTHAFLYDFTPDSLSAIRNMADPEYARLFPIDRRGRSRLADGQPDAGAYEGE